MKLPLPARAVRSVSQIRYLARRGVGEARTRLAESRLSSDFAPLESDSFLAAAYFSAGMSSVYQLEQWLWPFERLADSLRADSRRAGGPGRSVGLDRPVGSRRQAGPDRSAEPGAEPLGIFVRDAEVASHIRALTTLPVRFSRLSSGLDAFMSDERLRIVFYVNQDTGNFQALKYPRPAHVHLSHGESEKISMISNQLKAYDRVFTAGPAARARILDRLIGMDGTRLHDVGRPQLDRPWQTPAEWRDFTMTAPLGPIVFYAPTWEGDSPEMAYGTLAGNGLEIVSALFAAGYRVIFRPHPRTGVLDARFAAELAHVRQAVEDHRLGFVDRTPDVTWQLHIAEVALTEMSAVAFDWLSTAKPMVLLAPHDDRAELLHGGLLDVCPTISGGEETKVAEVIAAASMDVERFAELGRRYLGSTSPGTHISRFIDESLRAITDRESHLA